MYRAMLMLVLPGFAMGLEPSWRTDYAKASKEAAVEHKPLAVILGTGAHGWKKMGRDGGIGEKAAALLAEKYTPVYINTKSSTGKHLAKAFEMPEGFGIVLSDRTGALQAFRHQGDLSNRKLVAYLERFADPNRVVSKTVTNPEKKKATLNSVVPYCPTCSGCANGMCGK